MATLHIPPQHAAGLIALRKLSEGSLKELITGLAGVPPLLQPQDLVSGVVPQAPSIAESDLGEILEMLISLCSAQFQLGLSTSELADRVCNAMKQSDNKDVKLASEDCDDFKERLTSLLSMESLTYPAKAWGVVADHDRLFARARVLTDVRAVFGRDTETVPKGAVIIHMLNIAYQHSGKPDNFYVALDTEDIESLIATLQRALSKTRSLTKLLDQAKVAYLNPK